MIGGPVPVLPELLAVVAVRLAGQGDARLWSCTVDGQVSGFWVWSEVAVRLISSSALSSLDRRRYRHETIMSCLVVQDGPVPLPRRRSCLS